jgi:flagellar motor switch protein FliM
MRQLSQDEIDAFFRNRPGESANSLEHKATPFDFRRPDRIPKSQLRAIRFLHENFVRSLVSSLTAYLRAYLSGNLISVEQIPYTTFLEGLPAQTCMVPLTLLPFGGNALLEINPSLIYPILELLLGGKDTSTQAKRELTEMERHLLDSLFRLIAHDLEETWRGVADVEFRIDSLETGRQLIRTLGPTEAVVAIGMEFRIDDAAGMINLAMPSITIKGMVQKFDQQWTGGQSDPSDADQRRVLKLLRRAAVEVEPQLVSSLSVKDLLALEVGSVVVLDHTVNRPITSVANRKAKFDGEVVCSGAHRAFLVESVETPE